MIALSLANSALALLNGSAFLLLAAGPALATYILCSSIHSATSWLYSWVAPAAVGYRIEQLAVARILQCVPLAVGILTLLALVPTTIGILFVGILLLDFWASPSFLLLFHSQTKRFLLVEASRNVLNSSGLLLNILFLGGKPEWHAGVGLAISACVSIWLAFSGWLRPTPLRRVAPATLRSAARVALGTRQVRALLAARTTEILALFAFGQQQNFAAMLSLRLGLAINGSLAFNARRYALPLLLTVQLAAYLGLILLLIALVEAGIPHLPGTFHLLQIRPALLVLPVVVTCFILVTIGLRASDGQAVPRSTGQEDHRCAT